MNTVPSAETYNFAILEIEIILTFFARIASKNLTKLQLCLCIF